jgi:putative ABC transport system ATP-binding protein
MTLTEILGTFKTKLNLSRVMNPLERAADFYGVSGNGSEGNGSEGNESRDLKNNSYIYIQLVIQLRALMR